MPRSRRLRWEPRALRPPAACWPGIQGLLAESGPAVPFEAGQDGLAVFLKGFADTRPGDQARGVLEVEPADLAVGSGAQLEDGDYAAEIVEAGVAGVVIKAYVSSLARGPDCSS